MMNYTFDSNGIRVGTCNNEPTCSCNGNEEWDYCGCSGSYSGGCCNRGCGGCDISLLGCPQPPSPPPPCAPPPSDPQEAGSGGDIGSGSGEQGTFWTPCAASSPLMPPPLMPPPPPSPLAPGSANMVVKKTIITVIMTIAGDVSDFTDAAQSKFKAGLRANVCDNKACPGVEIALTIAAGSVEVTSAISFREDDASVGAAVETRATSLASATTAELSEQLGVTVESAPTVTVAKNVEVTVTVAAPSPPPPLPSPPPSPPPVLASPLPPSLPPTEEGSGESSDDSMFPLPMLIGASAGGGCIVLALIVGIAAACLRKKKAVQPLLPGGANSTAAAVAQAGAATASVTSARPSRTGLPSSLRPKSKKVEMAPAAEGVYNQNAADPAAGLNQAELAAAAAQLPGVEYESETARCLATMSAASGGAGSTPFSALVEAPLAPLAPLQGPAGGAGAGPAGLRPLAPPLTPLGGAGGAQGLRPLAPLGAVGGARAGGGGLAPLRPLGS